MEERLDDAINVLRNHAEPQIGLSQIPPNLGPPQMSTIGYVPQPETHISEPVKVERSTYNTSKFGLILSKAVSRRFCSVFSFRKTQRTSR